MKENLEGALVANLTILERKSQNDPGFIEYIITNAEAKDKFTISETGLLHTKVSLDREEKDAYRVVIAMGRRGVIRGKEVLVVDVQVEDENDNSPSFDRHIYQGSMKENVASGTQVLLGSGLQVSDPDLNDVVKLQLLGKGSNQFRLDPASGKVYFVGKSGLDRSQFDDKLYLRIRATDAVGHITESQLVVHIVDQDDAPPVVRWSGRH